MKVEWVYEARCDVRDFLNFYKVNVGVDYAHDFSQMIRKEVGKLAQFPEMGVLREDTLLGKHGFRALFIRQYACIYKVEDGVVFVYHLVDARRDYIYHIFGLR